MQGVALLLQIGAVASGAGGSMARINGGAICTCSDEKPALVRQ